MGEVLQKLSKKPEIDEIPKWNYENEVNCNKIYIYRTIFSSQASLEFVAFPIFLFYFVSFIFFMIFSRQPLFTIKLSTRTHFPQTAHEWFYNFTIFTIFKNLQRKSHRQTTVIVRESKEKLYLISSWLFTAVLGFFIAWQATHPLRSETKRQK